MCWKTKELIPGYFIIQQKKNDLDDDLVIISVSASSHKQTVQAFFFREATLGRMRVILYKHGSGLSICPPANVAANDWC